MAEPVVRPLDHVPRPFRLVGRLKNNRLWTAIIEQFPAVVTQTDAARALGISPTAIGNLLNCTTWPYSTSDRGRYQPGWTKLARRLERLLAVPAEHLFDPRIYGTELPRVDVELVFNRRVFDASAARLALPSNQEDDLLSETETTAIDDALRLLTPKEQKVVEARFGSSGGRKHTYKEVGHILDLSVERIRQIEAKALRKLRHSSRANVLRRCDDYDAQRIIHTSGPSECSQMMESLKMAGFKRTRPVRPGSYALLVGCETCTPFRSIRTECGFEHGATDVPVERTDISLPQRWIRVSCINKPGPHVP